MLGMTQVLLGATAGRTNSKVYEPKKDEDELEVGGQKYQIIEGGKGFELRPYKITTPKD